MKVVLGGTLVLAGSTLFSIFAMKLIAHAPDLAGMTHPSRKARDARGDAIRVHPAQGGPSSVGTFYDWQREEQAARDHRFLHVSLRHQATMKVAICSCGWQSPHHPIAGPAIEDWRVHREFASILGSGVMQ